MNKMFIKTREDGWHFDKKGIAKIEKHYGAKYMGYWAIKTPHSWTDEPVDVFYQPNPDVSKGHSHYFGMYINRGEVYITNAESAFSEPINGILTDDGEVLVSRYRHDFVSKDGKMIDGGRDYTRSSGGKFVNVTVKNGEYMFDLLGDANA